VRQLEVLLFEVVVERDLVVTPLVQPPQERHLSCEFSIKETFHNRVFKNQPTF
jgi:hypothetical protein